MAAPATASSKPQDEETPWHAAFPPPTLTPEFFPARRVLVTLSLKIASLLLIDVRRLDYTGGSIRGSLNIPAQGFYWNRGALYELAYKADMEWVVFVCGSGKEGGRAWRCAGWFLEHVRGTVGDEDMQVCVLEGGVKGWVSAGEEYRGFMDGFVEGMWEDVLREEKERNKEEQKTVEGSGEGQISAQAAAAKSDSESAVKTTEAPTEVKEKVWSFEAMMGD